MLSTDYSATKDDKGKRGRGRRGKKKAPKEFKLDTEGKNRIRFIPEIREFYEFVKKFNLREDAFKALVLFSMNDLQKANMRRLLSTRAEVEATA